MRDNVENMLDMGGRCQVIIGLTLSGRKRSEMYCEENLAAQRRASSVYVSLW